MAKAVFLDRDGLINEEIWDYVKSPEEFKLLPNTPKAIRLLNKSGILVIVVSNQAGIAKGYYDEKTLQKIHDFMRSELSKHGVYIDGIYYCPHHPDGKGRYRVNCGCRKPNPGMLLRAAEDFGLDLKRCWMIGDKLSDIEAGIRAGCKTILVLTGYGKRILKEKKDWKIEPHLIKKDLYEAVLTILQDSQ